MAPQPPRQGERTSGSSLVGLVGGTAPQPRSGRTLSDMVSGRVSEDPRRQFVRQTSMLGVDPRSAEGQQIVLWLESGIDVGSAEVQDLVGQYQSKLIGPQTRATRSEKTPTGTGPDMLNNQYGYQKGDEFRELDSIGAESLARTQERLAALGILDGYVEGKKDPATLEAMQQLLFVSNTEGLSWIEMLGELERTKVEMGDDWAWNDGRGGGREGPAPFVEQAYLAPDYATLAQTVKNQLRESLGRDPDDSEMALLTAELSGWDREAFQAEQDARRAEYEASVAAGEGAEGRSGGEHQTIDPLARFRESFESKFKAELGGIERSAEAAETQELTQGAVSTLSRMSGGMG